MNQCCQANVTQSKNSDVDESGSIIYESKKWPNIIKKIFKYPFIILVFNILFMSYVKYSLDSQNVVVDIKPLVPPFH